VVSGKLDGHLYPDTADAVREAMESAFATGG
jgi:hypothetical protein